jgi:hypothetical protein
MKKSVWIDTCKQIHDAGKKVYFDVFGLFSLDIAKQVGADGVSLSLPRLFCSNGVGSD